MTNKVLLKKSSVTAKTPVAADLDYGELALNYADGKLYFKNTSNDIKSFTIDDSVVTLTGAQTLTNKTLSSAILTGTLTAGGGVGTNGQVLTSTGTGVQWETVGAGSSGAVTSVSLSLPSLFTVSGSPVTTSGTLTATLASQFANTFLAGPNGVDGTPTMRAIVAADVPTLNQNTTGTASNVTGIVAINNGGTGATTATTALTALGAYPASNPSGYTNNIGTVIGVTGTAPIISSGGTKPAISISAATTVSAGSMSSADKTKLDGIAAGATANTGTVTSVIGTGTVAGLSLSGTVTSNGNLTLSGTLSTPVSTINDSTTLGQNLVKLTNVAAIAFPRINDDNTVSTLDAATFRTAIGAGTSSTMGTVTSVAGTGNVSGLTLSGTVTSTGNLTLGGTLAVTASNFDPQTGNTVLAAPNGFTGVPTFRSLIAADIPTLNQNTTGTAANVTGTVDIANGGTGATTTAAARTNLGATTLGSNLFTLTNVAAISFPRINADNTISSLDAADFRTAIGAGTPSPPVFNIGNATNITSCLSGAGGTGTHNFFAGQYAGSCNTTGSNNTFIGRNAGQCNTIGSSNNFIGVNAGQYNTIGTANNFIGFYAGSSNTVGNSNVFIGQYAGRSSVSASNNTFIGRNAGQCNTIGGSNNFIGVNAGQCNTIGTANNFIGFYAGSSNTVGNSNVFIGQYAGRSSVSASNNTFVGHFAGTCSTSGSNNVLIGRCSGYGTTGLANITTQSHRIIIGNNLHVCAQIQVAWTVVSDCRDKCIFGNVPHGRGFLQQLDTIEYALKDRETGCIIDPDGKRRYGFSAQNVLQAEGDKPVIVSVDNLEKLQLTSDYMIPILVNAINELSQESDTFKREIIDLKSRLISLESK